MLSRRLAVLPAVAMALAAASPAFAADAKSATGFDLQKEIQDGKLDAGASDSATSGITMPEPARSGGGTGTGLKVQYGNTGLYGLNTGGGAAEQADESSGRDEDAQ